VVTGARHGHGGRGDERQPAAGCDEPGQEAGRTKSLQHHTSLEEADQFQQLYERRIDTDCPEPDHFVPLKC
jgi:hypothetical protein